MNDEFESKITEYKRSLIRELFDQLPNDQKARFTRWTKGVDSIKKEYLKSSYYLLKRSLDKNNKEEQNVIDRFDRNK